MKALCFGVALVLFCLSGCSTPGSAYASGHPELSAAHCQILTKGKIPGGLAVEGMSKEQVRLAVGVPAKVEKTEGGEAWIYFQEASVDFDESGSISRSDTGAMNQKVTVFFQGDRATFAQNGEEPR